MIRVVNYEEDFCGLIHDIAKYGRISVILPARKEYIFSRSKQAYNYEAYARYGDLVWVSLTHVLRL